MPWPTENYAQSIRLDWSSNCQRALESLAVHGISRGQKFSRGRKFKNSIDFKENVNRD